MVTKVGEAFVDKSNVKSSKAGKKLVEQAKKDGDIEEPDFAVFFSSVNFNIEKIVGNLDSNLPNQCDWIGCSSAGEISKQGSTTTGAVLLLIETDEMSFQTSEARNVYEWPKKAGKESVKQLEFEENYENQFILTFVAGFTMEHDGVEFEILKGFNDIVSTGTPILGGAAGDDIKLEGSYQFHNGQIMEEGVVTALIQTDLELAHGQDHGLRNEVAKGVVTESEGRVIKKINGQPAAEFYAEKLDISLRELKKPYKFRSIRESFKKWLTLQSYSFKVKIHLISTE